MALASALGKPLKATASHSVASTTPTAPIKSFIFRPPPPPLEPTHEALEPVSWHASSRTDADADSHAVMGAHDVGVIQNSRQDDDSIQSWQAATRSLHDSKHMKDTEKQKWWRRRRKLVVLGAILGVLTIIAIIIGAVFGARALHRESAAPDTTTPTPSPTAQPLSTETAPGIDVGKTSAIAGGKTLRIMALGASITYGVSSYDGNGYRLVLENTLKRVGNPVEMVGSQRNGTMPDSATEGWPGYEISWVNAKAAKSVPVFKPNVVLINLGTDDAIQAFNVSTAGDRMTKLINDLYQWSPRTTVVLSCLLWNKLKENKGRTEKNAVLINPQYKTVAETMRAAGKRIVYADMRAQEGPQLNELAVDGTHPDKVGYAKMATVWFKALQDASTAGFIQDPEPMAANTTIT